MSYGLRVWDASGRMILHESSITTRLIGSASSSTYTHPTSNQPMSLTVYGGEIANDGRTFFKFEGTGYLMKARVISFNISSGAFTINFEIPYHGILGQELVKTKLSVFRF